MKRLVLLSVAILIATISATAQLAVSASMVMFPNYVNEDEVPEFDGISAENSFGFTIAYDSDPSEDVFDIYMSYVGGKLSMPLRTYLIGNNASTVASYTNGSAKGSFGMFKLGVGPQWYSSNLYIGLGGGIAFFRSEGEPAKSLTGYVKVGIGYSFFLEVSYEYLRLGEQLFGVPEGGMRLNMDNMQLTLGCRF